MMARGLSFLQSLSHQQVKRWTIGLMRLQRALPLSIIAAVLCLPLSVVAQSMRASDLGVGKMLVAPRECPDANFARAVILLVQVDENGAVGLMINHRTTVPISRALDQLKSALNHKDPVYLGGPVDASTVLALLRARTKPDEAQLVVGDIYLVGTRTLLERTLAAGTGPSEFRTYVGYCGWGPGQLETEMKLGAWFIFDGTTRLVFHSDPDSLWSRLIARTEQKVAQTRLPASVIEISWP